MGIIALQEVGGRLMFAPSSAKTGGCAWSVGRRRCRLPAAALYGVSTTAAAAAVVVVLSRAVAVHGTIRNVKYVARLIDAEIVESVCVLVIQVHFWRRRRAGDG